MSSRAAVAIVWALTLAYVAVFCALSLRRYDAFLMHALDMGNMEQAVWNTLHGQPFHFTNMLDARIGVEAFGTSTRLSFHVEPVFFVLAALHFLYPAPQTLLVVQTVVVASGALATYRIARRHLPESPLAAVAFALAYLCCPALQAANLYEFHPVTMTAALLLWAFACADEGRYLAFTVAALAAMACKEEIGVVVAMLALWFLLHRPARGGSAWWRRATAPGPARYWLLWGAAGVLWSLVAFGVIIPHFHHHDPTPYACRFVDPQLVDARHPCTSMRGVARLWLAHPDSAWTQLTLSPKLGFMHRLLAPFGYLSLLSLPALLPAIPALALTLLGREPHMYSGLAHYSAELVPPLVIAAILGTELLAYRWAPRLRLAPRVSVALVSLYLLAMSTANTHANGFGPLSAGLSYAAVTDHERIGHRLLALIPPDASVAASDMLDPHLSDRAHIYLFPYYLHVPSPHGSHGHPADYIFLDLSGPAFPLALPRLVVARIWNLLYDAHDPYSLVAAEDGYVLLKHVRPAHRVRRTFLLPRSFYSFLLPARPHISHPLVVNYGAGLQLLGYDVERREEVNLRAADVAVTTYWRPTRRLGQNLRVGVYPTNADGAIDWSLAPSQTDQMALDLLPTSTWTPGRIVAVRTQQLGLYTLTPGAVDLDLLVLRQGAQWDAYPGHADPYAGRVAPIVRVAPQPLEVVDRSTMLKLTSLAVPF